MSSKHCLFFIFRSLHILLVDSSGQQVLYYWVIRCYTPIASVISIEHHSRLLVYELNTELCEKRSSLWLLIWFQIIMNKIGKIKAIKFVVAEVKFHVSGISNQKLPIWYSVPTFVIILAHVKHFLVNEVMGFPVVEVVINFFNKVFFFDDSP